jgi:hypothetical protein
VPEQELNLIYFTSCLVTLSRTGGEMKQGEFCKADQLVKIRTTGMRDRFSL